MNSVEILNFLSALRDQNIYLSADSGELVLSYDAEAPTPELISKIRNHKAEILDFLVSHKSQTQQQLSHDSTARHAPFPLTDNQRAYWLGRDKNIEDGGVAIHLYFELNLTNFDLNKFERALNKVISRHDMLRAIVLADGTQQILKNVPYYHIQHKQDTSPDGLIAKTWRSELSHQSIDPMVWPSFDFRHLIEPQKETLYISIDCWAIDGWSYQLIFDELRRFYESPDLSLPNIEMTFRDYVLWEQSQKKPDTHDSQEFADILPSAPQLPMRQKLDQRDIHHFTRREFNLSQKDWQSFASYARQNGLTPAAALITAYADILRKWSSDSDFCVNIPFFNRHGTHPDLDKIVGEFATFAILESLSADGCSFIDRAKAIQSRLQAGLSGDRPSGLEILRHWRRQRGDHLAKAPYVFTNAPEQYVDGETISFLSSLEFFGEIKFALSQTPQLYIDCQYHEKNGAIYLFWDSQENRFEDGMVARMFDAYTDMILRLSRQSESWQRADIFQFPDSEKVILDRALLGKVQSFPPQSLASQLHDILSEQPHRDVLFSSTDCMTRGDFLAAIEQTISQLQAQGVTRKDPIICALPKGIDQAIVSYALLFMGAIIVPIDAQMPAKRLDHILTSLSPKKVIATSDFYQTHPLPEDMRFVLPPLKPDHQNKHTASAFQVNNTVDTDVIQIIFTSGSTGTPKGVEITEAGLKNALAFTQNRFDIGPSDRILSLTPYQHDMAWFDMFGVILGGGSLIFPDPSLAKDPQHWCTLIAKHSITLWNSVPAFMVMLLDFLENQDGSQDLLAKLRHAFLGGDWIPVDLPDRLIKKAPDCQLVSVGGPTETTLWNIFYPVTENRFWTHSIPYGTPIANTEYAVLDHQNQQCPVMVAGELVCFGPGVTPGYVNDPHRTELVRQFDPASGRYYFRTGDFGRVHQDGYIEFLGRQDRQAMINGVRIELGEIEKLATDHPQIRQAVAIMRRTGQNIATARKSIILYFRTFETIEELSESQVQKWLSERLTPQMMPARFIGCDQFPLTQNGKIDVSVLEKVDLPEATDISPLSHTPLTAKQTEIAGYWAELLNCSPKNLSQDSNFFSLGGDSILLVRLYRMLGTQGETGCTIADLFAAPTIAGHAKLAEQSPHSNPSYPALMEMDKKGQIYASSAQKRVWLAQSQAGENPFYNLPFHLRLSGQIDLERFKKALRQTIEHHIVFQSRFDIHVTGNIIVNFDDAPQYEIDISDLSGLTDAEKDHICQSYAHAEAHHVFSMHDHPLFRIKLIKRHTSEIDFLFTVHHALFDGLSSTIFFNDLLAFYESGQPRKKLPYTYADYCIWEQNDAWQATLIDDLTWWQQHLSDLKKTTLPNDKPLPVKQSFKADTLAFTLSRQQTHRIDQVAEKLGISRFVLLMGCFKYLLSQLLTIDDIAIATHHGGRPVAGSEDLVGMFVNTVIVRTGFTDITNFRQILQKTSESWQQTLAHVHTPFEMIVEQCAPQKSHDSNPFTQIGFFFENADEGCYRSQNITIQQLMAIRPGLHQNMECSFLYQDQTLQCHFLYAPDYYDHDQIDLFCQRYQYLLTHLEEALDQTESTYYLTPQDHTLLAKTRQVVSETVTSEHILLPVLNALSDLNEKSALIDRSSLISGAQLVQDIENYAQWLIDNCHITPGDRVGLHFDRSCQSVTFLLAILRCQAIWVPLDHKLPLTQISDLINRTAPKLILTDCQTIDIVHDQIIYVGPDFQPAANHLINLPDLSLKDGQEACWLSTSGSTGQPKIVRLTHLGIQNRRQWMVDTYPYDKDEACIHKTSLAFVDSIQEILAPLSAAIPLYIADRQVAEDPVQLSDFLAEHKITRLTAVPSLLRVLTQLPHAHKSSDLHYIISSGESLDPDLAFAVRRSFPQARLFNIYGSSEVSADVTCHEITEFDRQLIPIGRPINNIQIGITDQNHVPLPPGAIGEISVTGWGVANGYLGEDPTSRFSIHHHNAPHKNRFKTGDYGRLSADGTILYEGRRDDLVKIRGMRISLIAARNALLSLPSVLNAAICVHQTDQQEQSLWAALILNPNSDLTAKDLKTHLAAKISDNLLPDRLVLLPEFQYLPTGKLDLKNLEKDIDLAFSSQRETGLRFVAPENGLETDLSALWASLLEHPKISRDDHFFEMGGNSITAMKLVGRLRAEMSVDCPIHVIFDFPRLADQAQKLQEILETQSSAALDDEEEL